MADIKVTVADVYVETQTTSIFVTTAYAYVEYSTPIIYIVSAYAYVETEYTYPVPIYPQQSIFGPMVQII